MNLNVTCIITLAKYLEQEGIADLLFSIVYIYTVFLSSELISWDESCWLLDDRKAHDQQPAEEAAAPLLCKINLSLLVRHQTLFGFHLFPWQQQNVLYENRTKCDVPAFQH